MIITKSKYIDYITCERLFYLKENFPEKQQISEFLQLLAIEGIEVGKVGRGYLGEYILVDSIDKVKQTKEYINQGHKVIAEASFIYKDLFCSIDLLKIDEDGIEIYEIKSSSNLEDKFIDDISFQTYVLTKLGYNVKNSYILHINKNYILDKSLKLDELFIKENIQIRTDVENNLNELRKQHKVLKPLYACKHCTDNGKCPFYNYCYADLPKNNIFELAYLKNSYNYYNKGIITFNDYLNNTPTKTGKIQEKILEQIDFELNNLPMKVEKDKLNDFLNTLKYPLYYLDFETIKKPIPKYSGYKTNQRLLIQYSLHIQEEINGPLIHKEYLLTDEYDNRIEVAKRLIEDLGNNGSIIVYFKQFESGVISELSELVPSLKNELLELNKRIVDLELPFKNRVVYNKNMIGKSSIKKVLPAMRDDFKNSYKDLSLVHNGVDAMTLYNKMLRCKGNEKQKIIDGLLEYCCLDTMAMVVILEKLYSLKE